MAKKKTPKKSDELSFENSFKELQEIVSRLEDGHLPLGDALQSYDIGIKRLQECYQALNDAERKIEKLSKLRADGTFESEEFETTQSRKAKKTRSKSDDEDGLF